MPILNTTTVYLDTLMFKRKNKNYRTLLPSSHSVYPVRHTVFAGGSAGITSFRKTNQDHMGGSRNSRNEESNPAVPFYILFCTSIVNQVITSH